MAQATNPVDFLKSKFLFRSDGRKKTEICLSENEAKDNSEYSENETEFKSSCFRCLCFTYNFLYYCFVFPFKICVQKINQNDQKQDQDRVELEASGPRMIAWIVCQGLFVILSIESCWKTMSFKNLIAEDPTQLYFPVARWSWCAVAILWPYWVITRKDLVRRILAKSYKLQDERSCGNFFVKNQGLALTVIFCASIFMFSILNVYDSGVIFLTSGKLPSDYESIIPFPSLESYTNCVGGTVFLILFVIINSLCIFNNFMVIIPGLVSCIVIYGIADDFTRHVKQFKDNHEQTVKILKTFYDVRKLVKDINSTWSFFLFLIIISIMAEFSNDFTFLIGDKSYLEFGGGWLTRVQLSLYFLLLTVCLLLAAESHNKFLEINKTILTNAGKEFQELERKVEIIMLQNEISQDPMGVLAHHFIVSYSALSTILSSVLTYIFIFLQFQSADKTLSEQ